MVAAHVESVDREISGRVQHEVRAVERGSRRLVLPLIHVEDARGGRMNRNLVVGNGCPVEGSGRRAMLERSPVRKASGGTSWDSVVSFGRRTPS